MREVFIVCARARAPATLWSACIEIALYHDLHSSAGGLTLRDGVTDRVKVKKEDNLMSLACLQDRFWCSWGTRNRMTVNLTLFDIIVFFAAVAS